jgi:hypothetical protein
MRTTYNVRTGVTKIKSKARQLTNRFTIGAAAGVSILGLALMPAASAASNYTLFGAATIVSGGQPGNAAQLVSDPTVAPGYAGVNVTMSAPINWTSLTTLSTDYNVTDDSCGGGSPRIVLDVDTTGDGVADGDVSISVGPSPNFTNCATGWQSTGNLIGNNDAGRYDFSHLGGSTFATYNDAPASVQAGKVVATAVVVDGSWNSSATGGDSEQTVLVDNVTLNSTVVTFEAEAPVPTKDSCKNNGWKSMTNPGPFKNQGDCVSYFATNGKNLPNGL